MTVKLNAWPLADRIPGRARGFKFYDLDYVLVDEEVGRSVIRNYRWLRRHGCPGPHVRLSLYQTVLNVQVNERLNPGRPILSDRERAHRRQVLVQG